LRFTRFQEKQEEKMDLLGLEIGQIKKLLENMNNMGMGFTQAPDSDNCLIKLESMGESPGIDAVELEENMSGDELGTE
jgi:hypothetical protein